MIIYNPEGNGFKIKGLTQFCKEHGLSSTCMSRVANGKATHHKNWVCFHLEDL